jgi:hypothetical protein
VCVLQIFRVEKNTFNLESDTREQNGDALPAHTGQRVTSLVFCGALYFFHSETLATLWPNATGTVCVMSTPPKTCVGESMHPLKVEKWILFRMSQSQRTEECEDTLFERGDMNFYRLVFGFHGIGNKVARRHGLAMAARSNVKSSLSRDHESNRNASILCGS